VAVEVAGGLAEALEAARDPVHGVHLDEGVDQLLGDAAALAGESSASGTFEVITTPSSNSSHRRHAAEHRLVLAGGEHTRRAHIGVLCRVQKARLAQHVVRRRRQRWPRRPPQDEMLAAAPDLEGDVRVPLAIRSA